MRGLHAEVEMELSEETAAAINDLLFPAPRKVYRVGAGRGRRILRKPLDSPEKQPDSKLDR